MRGVVKFFKPDKGWGALMSTALPAGQDAFVHFSAIQGGGYRALEPGDVVEFEAVPAVQDSFRWVAAHVARVGPGPAPLLRREGDHVVAEVRSDPGPPAR